MCNEYMSNAQARQELNACTKKARTKHILMYECESEKPVWPQGLKCTDWHTWAKKFFLASSSFRDLNFLRRSCHATLISCRMRSHSGTPGRSMPSPVQGMLPALIPNSARLSAVCFFHMGYFFSLTSRSIALERLVSCCHVVLKQTGPCL